ncbi:DNA alkylation repair protein [Pseudarthrobacter sp. NIBRBAC000502770]|uniref:DNA alkylation repair protein n=1 Tax=Pseudarthrobacter sp. NIBRBAC000502770 TaxID=2590785 RepID=UPI00113FE996|nr:DNA alkylation repair protein [Pseudarthrobacter sp. NIBRBAC000502770]QDG88638.1 DNA alkylation repair protein [Pseudarthrobacter sp. NIBRBAC000502770]
MDSAPDQDLIASVRAALRAMADPVRAAGAQAYMKSLLPSLGVRVPDVRRITADAARTYPPASAAQLRATVLDLWRTAMFREEKYAAIDLTAHRLVTTYLDMLPVYEEIIRTGAWWDFADGVSGRICSLLLAHPEEMATLLRQWSRDPDLWIRRAAITSQLRAGTATDTELLAAVIEPNLADPEFFIRKAIGWALREYAKRAPDWVEAFAARHRDAMSPLSRREALRRISSAAPDGSGR